MDALQWVNPWVFASHFFRALCYTFVYPVLFLADVNLYCIERMTVLRQPRSTFFALAFLVAQLQIARRIGWVLVEDSGVNTPEISIPILFVVDFNLSSQLYQFAILLLLMLVTMVTIVVRAAIIVMANPVAYSFLLVMFWLTRVLWNGNAAQQEQ